MQDTISQLDALLREGRYAEVEQITRGLLAKRRFYLWHLYLIVALQRAGERKSASSMTCSPTS